MNTQSRFPHMVAAAAIVLTGFAAVDPAQSQTAPARTDCAASASTAEPATAPDRDTADGTSPGNSGSTGWTGGTGGAYVGTNPQGAVASSTTWQPPTARGLDLAMGPEAAEPC